MDKLNVNTIEPEGGTTTLNVGLSGKNVIITDNLKANTLKDAGGNTIFTSDGSGNLSSVNSGFGSAQVLLSTQTASDSASLSFTSGIDSTYKEYLFEWCYIQPDTNNTNFTFQASTDGGSNYNTTVTSTFFNARHNEANSDAALDYEGNMDQAQGTAYQVCSIFTGADADECTNGVIHLFNPSSTTYVKNWYGRTSSTNGDTSPAAMDGYPAGYFNTTSAINAISFKYASGNIAAGKIKMYGIK